MAIQFFETEEVNQDLEFLNDWIKKNPKALGKAFFVDSITAVKSGKGYLLSTDNFNVFIWKKASILIPLFEAIEHYINEGNGYAIVIQPDAKAKDGYLLGADFEICSYWSKKSGSYYSSVTRPITGQSTMEDTNPFLPPIPIIGATGSSATTTQTTESQEQTSKNQRTPR